MPFAVSAQRLDPAHPTCFISVSAGRWRDAGAMSCATIRPNGPQKAVSFRPYGPKAFPIGYRVQTARRERVVRRVGPFGFFFLSNRPFRPGAPFLITSSVSRFSAFGRKPPLEPCWGPAGGARRGPGSPARKLAWGPASPSQQGGPFRPPVPLAPAPAKRCGASPATIFIGYARSVPIGASVPTKAERAKLGQVFALPQPRPVAGARPSSPSAFARSSFALRFFAPPRPAPCGRGLVRCHLLSPTCYALPSFRFRGSSKSATAVERATAVRWGCDPIATILNLPDENGMPDSDIPTSHHHRFFVLATLGATRALRAHP